MFSSLSTQRICFSRARTSSISLSNLWWPGNTESEVFTDFWRQALECIEVSAEFGSHLGYQATLFKQPKGAELEFTRVSSATSLGLTCNSRTTVVFGWVLVGNASFKFSKSAPRSREET
jgi:hypothetical protein